jgi:hypothetical protein
MKIYERLSIRQKIYDYLENKQSTYDEVLAGLAAEAMKYAVVRQLMEDQKGPTKGYSRCSLSGPCARKVALKYLGAEPNGKEIDARAKITFLNGDLLEVVVVMLMRLSGIQVENTILDGEGQTKVEFRVNNNILVPGSGDGYLPVQEGLDEPYLLEVKTASDYGFKYKFAKGIIDDGYLLQHNVYLDAYGLDKGVFVAVAKNTGEIAEIFTEKDPEFVKWAKFNHHAARYASLDDLPPRYHDGDGYGIKENKKGQTTVAPLCTYCEFMHKCWPDTKLEIVSGRPVFVLNSIPEDFLSQLGE